MPQENKQILDVVDNLKSQHQEILVVVKELSTILNEVESIEKAVKARSYLNQLGTLLGPHLQIEDKLLYPILKKSPHPKVKETAIVFSDEMGGIGIRINRYMEKWPTSVLIANEANSFIKETKVILTVLIQRISKEDNELFPLLTQ